MPLSGNLSDGTAGLHGIKQRGGIAVVQDPASGALSQHAAERDQVQPDHVAQAEAIPKLLIQLTGETALRLEPAVMDRSESPGASLDEAALDGWP